MGFLGCWNRSCGDSPLLFAFCLVPEGNQATSDNNDVPEPRGFELGTTTGKRDLNSNSRAFTRENLLYK